MNSPVRILAFGSLMYDRGRSIGDHINDEKSCETPFPVEYGRISQSRSKAPTLVRHPLGAPVTAQILTLDDAVSVDDAIEMLWRRETGITDPAKHYKGGNGPNNVLIKNTEVQGITALYVDFNESGKELNPTPLELARYAIESVEKADLGQDGITYLKRAIDCGIQTPLTERYKSEILRQADARDLCEALCIIRTRLKDIGNAT